MTIFFIYWYTARLIVAFGLSSIMICALGTGMMTLGFAFNTKH